MNNTNNEFHASPAIRKLARELAVDLSFIKGSGKKGRIIDKDLKNYIKNTLAKTIDSKEEIQSIALTKEQILSAKNIINYWQNVAHITQFDEVNVDQMEHFRLDQKAREVVLPPVVFVIKALVQVLKTHPQFNASLDNHSLNILVKKYYNLGIAVDSKNGLLVAIIRDVDKKSLIDITTEINKIKEGAKSGSLQDEADKAGLILVDLSDFELSHFTSIVNSSQIATIGISKIQIKPKWEGKDFVPANIMPLSMSYDNRVIDNFQGAKFMTQINHVLSNIMEILL